MRVHIVYENEDWMPPLRQALKDHEVPFREHLMVGGTIDISRPPERGVWLNRMSPSSHTRGHQAGVALAHELFWQLEQSGSRVINGSRAFALEVSKIRQHAALEAFGICTPRTLGVVGAAGLKDAAREMKFPFITKHNQGGKGLGVQLFRSYDVFDDYVDSDRFVPSPDDITLLQEYIEPRGQFITRIELVNGRFQYALQSSTAQGFELCPADACAIDDQQCPVGDTGLFSLREEVTADDALVHQYIGFCKLHGVEIAGIEFVEDAEGRRYTYDLNGTTNFNSDVEAKHGLHGMGAVAVLCKEALEVLAA